MKKLIKGSIILGIIAVLFDNCHHYKGKSTKKIDSLTFLLSPIVIEGRLIKTNDGWGPVIFKLIKVEKVLKNKIAQNIGDTILVDGDRTCVFLVQSDTSEVIYLQKYDTIDGVICGQFYKVRHPYSFKNRNCK